ncbi:O-antigen ligase family protein [Vibrio ishigakensis]|uniref:O-antigen ligase family protein n=1 Tax=Vibrio ishigakensis TaxID=1481914 RepID=UPI0021C4C905|nr:hypothetical protein [Vibrio ishigakensis]
MITKLLSIVALVGISLFSFNLVLLPDQGIILYDSKRIFLCFLIVLSCLFIVVSENFREKLALRFLSSNFNIKLFTIVFFLLAFLSDISGDYFTQSITNYFYYFGLFLLILIFSIGRPAKLHFRFLSIISTLCFLSVFVGYSVANFLGDGAGIFHILSYANPRFMNQVQIWLMIPLLYIALISRSKLAFIFPILNCAAIVALDARGLAVASFGGILLWCLIDRRRAPEILKTALICFSTGAVISYIFLTPLPSLLLHGEQSRSLLDMRGTTEDRLSLWKYAIDMSSFWGLGSDGFVCNSVREVRPHNSILKIILNWGVVPAFCYICLCLILLKQVFQEKNYRYRIIGLSLLSGLAHSLISGVLDSPLSLLLACLFTGWFCSRAKYDSIAPLNKWYHGFLIVMCSLSIYSVTLKVYERVSNDFYRWNVEEVVRPQFWAGNNCPARNLDFNSVEVNR